jgi:hypothetical protein
MIHVALIVIFGISVGCSEDWKSEDFIHEKGGKGKQEFLMDSQKCVANKGKFSHLIQGRELGFDGEHTGYLGCMKLQGWSKKETS